MISYIKPSNNSNIRFGLSEDNLSSLKILLASILGIRDFEEIYSVVQAFIEREIIDEESVDDLNDSLNIEMSSEKEDEEE